MENKESQNGSKECPFELSNEITLFDGKWMSAKQVDFKLKGTNNHGVSLIHRNIESF